MEYDNNINGYLLGQDTLLSLCLSPSRYVNGYWQIYCWGQACDGVASNPGKSRNTPSRFMLLLLLNGKSSGLMGHITQMQTLTFLF